MATPEDNLQNSETPKDVRPMFGNRYLVNEEDVFEHNAWYETNYSKIYAAVSHEIQKKANAWFQIFAGHK